MADNVCQGECIKCSLQQQIYCAAQHGHAVMNNQRSIVERLDRLEQILTGKVGAGGLINPMEGDAQESPGAENKGHHK